MKRSTLKTLQLKAYKAKKVAIKDMNKIMTESQKSLIEILNINPNELLLDI